MTTHGLTWRNVLELEPGDIVVSLTPYRWPMGLETVARRRNLAQPATVVDVELGDMVAHVTVETSTGRTRLTRTYGTADLLPIVVDPNTAAAGLDPTAERPNNLARLNIRDGIDKPLAPRDGGTPTATPTGQEA